MPDKKKKCTGRIEIRTDGSFEISKMSPSCPVVLKKINPVRGIFWKNHLPEKEKEMIEKKQQQN